MTKKLQDILEIQIEMNWGLILSKSKTQIKIQIMILLVVMSTVGNAFFIPRIKCQCEQELTKSDCLANNCGWGIMTQDPYSGYCSARGCEVLNQKQCNEEYERCYYQKQTGTDQQVCFNLSKCEDIILTPGTTCQEANYLCIPSNLSYPQCISPEFSCSAQTQFYCSTFKYYTLAGEGLCYWNGTSCKVVSQCEEIKFKDTCQQVRLESACYWTGTVCIPQSCQSMYQNLGICTFIQKTPQSDSIIQPCYLNGTICQPGNISDLNKDNCASNTNNHFRWVPTDQNNGFCVQCNPMKYAFRNQCECQQLLQKNECIDSGSCNWTPAADGTNTGTCAANPCSAYTIQEQCAQTKGCFWQIDAFTNCQIFQSCNQIFGWNAILCYSYSNFCPGSNGTYCLSFQQLNNCSAISKNQPTICNNSIGKDGHCVYYNLECQAATSCSLLYTRNMCNQYSYSCSWEIYAYPYPCRIKTCQDYFTESSCTFVQNNINNNIINICTWNSDTKQCTSFDNSLSYDVNSCYNATGKTHHWSEPSNAQKGFCLPCNYSSVLTVKSNCSCQDLINYTDCALSFPQCYWNANTNSCKNIVCNQLTSQATCILNKQCYWSSKSSICQGDSSIVNCSQLSANTQQECLSQSIVCAGINRNGQCQSFPNSCSDFNTFYQCFGSVGTEGICSWDQISSKCQSISDCNMIKTQAQCQLVFNTCYWGNQGNGSDGCIAYNCTSLLTQNKTCNYYLSSPNQNYEVKYCFESGSTCYETSNLSRLTSSNCYSSSAGTARWDSQNENGTCVQCYSQIISFIFILLNYMI